MQSSTAKIIIDALKKNLIVSLFVVAVSALSFFVGSLWTKVQVYEGLIESGVGGSNVLPAKAAAEPEVKLDKPTNKDHVRGSSKAQIALIEYSDFSCPYCKNFHETVKQLLNDYDGKVKWVYRHFPLPTLHPLAIKQSQASECANKLGGNDKFWAMADKLYASETIADDTTMKKFASEIGLDTQKFADCLDNSDTKSIVDADIQSATRAGVTGTPGSFLMDLKTGEFVKLGGALPYEQLKASVDAILE